MNRHLIQGFPGLVKLAEITEGRIFDTIERIAPGSLDPESAQMARDLLSHEMARASTARRPWIKKTFGSGADERRIVEDIAKQVIMQSAATRAIREQSYAMWNASHPEALV